LSRDQSLALEIEVVAGDLPRHALEKRQFILIKRGADAQAPDATKAAIITGYMIPASSMSVWLSKSAAIVHHRS